MDVEQNYSEFNLLTGPVTVPEQEQEQEPEVGSCLAVPSQMSTPIELISSMRRKDETKKLRLL
jgi:hypothetical protein